jgi:hypothetical protein
MQNEWVDRFAEDVMAIDAGMALVVAVLTGILISNLWIAGKIQEVRAAMAEKPRKPGTTPSHVLFSDKVLGVPVLPGFLDRPLWVQNPNFGGFVSFRRQGDWIEQGETIAELVIKNRIFPNPVVARIRSPISGRLLYTNNSFPFGMAGEPSADWLHFLCVIEIPVGEEVSTDIWTAFGEFSELLWTFREPVLQKPKDGSFPPYPDEVIRRELDTLLSRKAEVISKDQGSYRRRAEWLNLHVPHGIGSSLNLAQQSSFALEPPL